MSEVDQLLQIVDGILFSKDKALREQAESTLVELRSNPNPLMTAFLHILAGTPITTQARITKPNTETSPALSSGSAFPSSVPPPTPTCGPASPPKSRPSSRPNFSRFSSTNPMLP